MSQHLVLIETSGNQAYIFATNRLRQNVGASELILRSGSQWVLEAVQRQTNGRPLWHDDSAERARRLCDERWNPPLGSGGSPVEVVTATSGRALLLVDSHDRGREIVTDVTRKALQLAPGLGVTGVVVPSGDGEASRHWVYEAHREAGKQLSTMRGRLAWPEARFKQLPIVAFCRTSGLPASVYDVPYGKEPAEEQSAVARAKFRASAWTETRIQRESAIALAGRLADSPARLQEVEAWLAVIHADGNGVGSVIQSLPDRQAEDHVTELRSFSTGLELAALRAFDAALEAAVAEAEKREWLVRGDVVPLVPLVVGGDDLTLLCDGRMALDFAKEYLGAFERETERALAQRLSAAAGVAFVKPHYPFHAAYELADGLVGSAKLAKRYAEGCSALDFHVHKDSTGADLASIRAERRSRAGDLALWGGPYVVGGEAHESGWARAHALKRLEDCIRLLQARDEQGRRRLSSSLAHRLRSALAESPEMASYERERALRRFPRDAVWAPLQELLCEERSLRGAAPGQDGEPAPERMALFIDAMEASGLWSPGRTPDG